MKTGKVLGGLEALVIEVSSPPPPPPSLLLWLCPGVRLFLFFYFFPIFYLQPIASEIFSEQLHRELQEGVTKMVSTVALSY